MFKNEIITRNISSCFCNESNMEIKSMKRPNLYENISFLIRRKKEQKNKNSLSRIR